VRAESITQEIIRLEEHSEIEASESSEKCKGIGSFSISRSSDLSTPISGIEETTYTSIIEEAQPFGHCFSINSYCMLAARIIEKLEYLTSGEIASDQLE